MCFYYKRRGAAQAAPLLLLRLNFMYQTILFDFDGTLTPSLELWLQAFQYALRQYERELPEETIIRRFFYRDYHDVVQEFDLPSGPELERHVHDGLSLAFASPRLFPGVLDVLDFCRADGTTLGLVTSSPRKQVLSVLGRLGVETYFEAIVTGDDITHYKPHPEPVQKALGLLGKSPTETLFVGDYLADVLAGQAAGTKTALFLPGQHERFYDFAALRALGPDFVFSAYGELREHLRLN